MSGEKQRAALTLFLVTAGCLVMAWVEGGLQPVYPVKSALKAAVFLGCSGLYVLLSRDRVSFKALHRTSWKALKPAALLSFDVLTAMKGRPLKAKSIKEFERYGIRRIMTHFKENEWVFYSKKAVWDFVLQERARMESGQLPAYQWAHTRRAAVYLEQMAEHSKIQEESLPKWETEHNRLFRLVTQGEPLAQDIASRTWQIRVSMS